MSKKKGNKKLTNREKNAFPFLSTPLDERLKQSGAIDLDNNHRIIERGDYWTIVPLDPNKQKKE